MSNPAQLRQLMDSPVIQSITNNPDLLRSLLLSNPQIRDLMEVNLLQRKQKKQRFFSFFAKIFSAILKYPIYLTIPICFGKQWNSHEIPMQCKNSCVIMIVL